jgi:hypothetical protein
MVKSRKKVDASQCPSSIPNVGNYPLHQYLLAKQRENAHCRIGRTWKEKETEMNRETR